MGELAFADFAHHALISRAVCVLAGVAGILENLIILNVQYIFGKVGQLLLLEGQAVLVNLIECRYTNV